MSKEDALDSKEQKKLETLYALIALAGKSDRAIAKILGISNATLSKRKRKLEQEGYIKEYTTIPDFHKMGRPLILFALTSTTDFISPQQIEEAKRMFQKYPEVLCVLDGQKDERTYWVVISVHKNYEDYLELSKNVQKETALFLHQPPNIETHSCLIETGKHYVKPFSLQNFGSSLFLSKINTMNRRDSQIITPSVDK